MYPRVGRYTQGNHELTKKITGMMVDLNTLSIQDIMDFIDDEELLKE